MNKGKTLMIGAGIILALASVGLVAQDYFRNAHIEAVSGMVKDLARSWETGDEALLAELLSDDSVFAYPGRRLNKEQALEDIRYFKDNFSDTKVYINTIVVEGDAVAVEWQFATTNNASGKREVVSDAVIAKVKDGKFTSWKEYLDGRVKGLQAEGKLLLEEGSEPFPWPEKTATY